MCDVFIKSYFIVLGSFRRVEWCSSSRYLLGVSGVLTVLKLCCVVLECVVERAHFHCYDIKSDKRRAACMFARCSFKFVKTVVGFFFIFW